MTQLVTLTAIIRLFLLFLCFYHIRPSSAYSGCVQLPYSCPALALTCAPYASYNTSIDCQSVAINCLQWYLHPDVWCTCPDGYWAPDCALVRPPPGTDFPYPYLPNSPYADEYVAPLKTNLKASEVFKTPAKDCSALNPGTNLTWDGSFMNGNLPLNKEIYCQVIEGNSDIFFNMHGSRVELITNAPNNEITLTMYAMLNYPLDPTDKNPNDCGPVRQSLSCSLSKCQQAVPAAGLPADAVQYECESHVCSTCQDAACATFEVFGVALTSSPNPLTIQFYNTNITAGYTQGAFVAATSAISLTIPVQCWSGQCIQPQYAYTPPKVTVGTAVNPSQEDNYVNTTIGLTAMVTAIYLSIAILAIFMHNTSHWASPGAKKKNLLLDDETPRKFSLKSEEMFKKSLEPHQSEQKVEIHYTKKEKENLEKEGNDVELIELEGKQEVQTAATQSGIFVTIHTEIETESKPSTFAVGSGASVAMPHFITEPAMSNTPTPSPSAGSKTTPSSGSGIGVVLDDVSYSIRPTGSAARTILNHISAVIPPGKLIGLLGPSGSGKTSLLNLIAGFGDTSNARGRIQIFGQPLKDRKSHPHISFVLQDELLLQSSTVREALEFSCGLRCPKEWSPAQRQKKVDETLRKLSLSHVADSRIGHPTNGGGISGGERRRTAVAVELVSNPSLLLMDEPLSGLDSFSAEMCLNVVRSLSDETGCGSIISIHQSSMRLLSCFDFIGLLSRNGQLAYFGPPSAAHAFLKSEGFHRPDELTVAEFLLELASSASDECLDQLAKANRKRMDPILAQTKKIHTARSAGNSADLDNLDRNAALASPSQVEKKELATKQEGTEMKTRNKNGGTLLNSTNDDDITSTAVEKLLLREDFFQNSQFHDHSSSPQRSFCFQFFYLFRRQFFHIAREPLLLLSHLVVTLAVALFIGFAYYNLDDLLSGFQNRIGFFFFALTYFCLTSLSTIASIMSLRPIQRWEQQSGFYSTHSFFVSHVLNDFLWLRILPTLMFCIITYWLLALQDSSSKFLLYVFILVVQNLTATSLCLFLAAVASTIDQASFLAVILLMFCILFIGLIVNIQTGSALIQIQYLSFCRYAYEIITTSEFQGLQFNINFNLGLGTSYLLSSSSTTTTSGTTAIAVISGEAFMYNLGFSYGNIGRDIGLLFAFLGVFLCLAYFFVAIRANGVQIDQIKRKFARKQK